MTDFDIPEKEIEEIFREIIVPGVIGNIVPQDKKEAFLLGGQPGSGKSSLAPHILALHNNIVFVNGDDLRAYHPKYYSYLQQDDREAANLTQNVCNVWIEGLIKECKERGLNMMVEGTMRRKEVPIATAKDLQDAGYRVTLVVISVPYDVSLSTLEYRYEISKKPGAFVRFTKKESHDEAHQNIEDTMQALVDTELFDEFHVYKRHIDGFSLNIFNAHEKESAMRAFREGRMRIVDEKEIEFLKSLRTSAREFELKII